MSSPNISFNLTFPEPQTHYVEVLMHIDNISNEEYIDVKMPVWAPGSYLIREYSKNIERISALTEDNQVIPIKKQNKNTWRIYHAGKNINLHYAVYAFEISVRTSFIDHSRAFLSPVGIFMYLANRIELATTVKINLPAHWSTISTGLPIGDEQNAYYAENFDILYDSPFEIGNHETWQFDIDGIVHECAMVGIADYNKEQLTEDISKIVREENKIWQSNPNNYYLIVTQNFQNAHGGLEHLNSTILAASRFAYSNPQSYKSYLSLVAHEYFHLWNVKRLRPKALGPFNYDEENYTTGLWIMEGFTSYYDNLILRRCGIYNEKEYLQQLALDFNTVYNRPGHTLQSAAQSSFDTWIKQYRPDENSQNVSISYYNKGAMHAVALDITILAKTNGEFRLDDVIKHAYTHFYLTENRGFEENELLELAEKVTGVSLKDIFNQAHSTRDIDYNIYFNQVGHELIDLNANQIKPSLGIKTAINENKVIIKNIDRDSAAWKAGLNVNDEIIALNNHRVDENGKVLDYFTDKLTIGDHISVLIARDGILHNLEVQLLPSDKKSFIIQRKDEATPKEIELGNIWLSI